MGGCTATASINVSVNRDLRIFVPNAFSPNDDGINDLFMIYSGNQINLVKSFQVMNRWGDLIFTANDFQPEDPDNAWDGSFNGKMLNPGVYIYLAEVELADGEVVVISGDVTLLY
jgi:gliding motility-associated-like protein